MIEAAGGALAAFGYAVTPDQNGNSPWASAQAGNAPDAIANATGRVSGVVLSPVTGGNTSGYFNGPNEAFWGGIGLAIAGWAIGKVVPATRRMGFKVGRHHKITLT